MIRRKWRSIGGTAMAVGCSAFAWGRLHTRWSLALLVLAAVSFVLALALPRAWAPVQALLDLMARAIMAAITWLVLVVLFAACFIPGRFVMAVFRRDPLRRAWEPARNSYWEPLPRAGAQERFRRQF
jgi:hypothetical protein